MTSDSTAGYARWRMAQAILAVALVAGFGLRVWLALTDDGFYWPDEIYQSLEPAHRLVYGYGWMPWEFVEGLRTWAVPGFVALIMKVTALLGGTSPEIYIRVTKIVFAALGVATAWGSYRLARSYKTDVVYAAGGAALFGLAAPAIYFGPRAFSESMSALPVVLGLALLLPESTRRARLAGGSLLGLAVLMRLHNALFCMAVLGTLLVRRRFRELLETGLVFAAGALFYGLVDRLTWGEWFHSAGTYLRFSLLEGGAARWGTEPFWYYGSVMWTSMGALAVVTIALAVIGSRIAFDLALVIAVFVFAHSVTPHKEFRFMVPMLPLLAALASVGLEQLARSPRRGRTPADLLLFVWLSALAVSALQWRTLTFGQLGRPGPPESTSAYDYNGPLNRLLLVAHRTRDLCGLKIEGTQWADTGGYSYFHRPVPLYGGTDSRSDPIHFNYLITRVQESPPDAVGVAFEGGLGLVRVRDGCVTDPEYSWMR
jgi:hypothetical protein